MDTGPLVAAADKGDPYHRLAATMVQAGGRDLVVLDTVMVETDWLLRSRRGADAARGFLNAIAREEHRTAALTPGLVKRAAEFDEQYAALSLGLVDASLMAYAERHKLPILTFDHRDFRATGSANGPWKLVIDENTLERARGLK